MVNLLFVGLPRLAVWRIGDHIAKRLVGKGIVGNGIPQMHSVRINTFDNQIRLADGVCFRVDFRTRELDSRTPHANIQQILTAFGQHTT